MMDVRASLNTDSNLTVITGDGEKSFVENDSFYAMVPPQAASTVGRTKARRFMQQDSDMGSFLDDVPMRSVSPFEMQPSNQNRGGAGLATGNKQGTNQQNVDWSVVNAWCRDNAKSDIDQSSQDDRSSMGIINIDEMDLSTNNLLLETPQEELRSNRDLESFGATSGSVTQKNMSENSTLKSNTPSSLFSWKHEGSSSNSSQDTKPDQPFARSQIDTVKKTADKPKVTDPVTAAIRHSLFGQMTIGEEGEDKDASIYQVELQADELNAIDNELGDIDLSDDSEGEEKAPVREDLPQMTVSRDEIRIDSIYFRPGIHGEEQPTSHSLPFLSKVSLFEGGSGSEIDTEDELEQVRKEQGARHEAAGQASSRDTSRPGLEGDCSDDHSGEKRLPITQRQSAEGDVVSSPVPGDGGGGGDGSSDSESDDGRVSRATSGGMGSVGYASNLPSNRQSQTREQEEQRIRPMGDDLLSEMRFSKYEASANPEPDDVRLHSRYLAHMIPVEDSQPESVLVEDFLNSHNHTGEDEDFFPGNRLEASGFNADDVSTGQNQIRDNSDPFGQFESSWGSFGIGQGDVEGQGRAGGTDSSLQMDPIGVEMMQNNRQNASEGNRSSEDRSWNQLIGSAASSKQNSLGSEPRTSRDAAPPPLPGFEQADYARLGSEDRRSAGRSSGSGSPSRSITGMGMDGQASSSNVARSLSSETNSNQFGATDSGIYSGNKFGATDGANYCGNKFGASDGANYSGNKFGASDGANYSGNKFGASDGANYSGNKFGASDGAIYNGNKFGATDSAIFNSNKFGATDSAIFKKPFLPAPKAAAVFTKSVSKPKTSQSNSYHSSSGGKASGQSSSSGGKASGQSSSSSGRSNMGDFVNDLAFRISLTSEAQEQKFQLQRVPSLGETNTMDMTVNDEEFFGNADALAMLDQDENQFNEEHVFRQDDPMMDTSVGNSWAHKSIMSVARPSWLQDMSKEEGEVVRISVGTYIRGRTGALGSLDGDESCQRPDFGMSVSSPKKDKLPAGGLIEEEEVFEGTRTSGVGEYNTETDKPVSRGIQDGEKLHRRLDSENIKDDTMTMDSLLLKTPKAGSATGDIDSTITQDISAFLKASSDDISISTMMKEARLKRTLKDQNKGPTSPSKPSQLPIKKGSNLNRSPQSPIRNGSRVSHSSSKSKDSAIVLNYESFKEAKQTNYDIVYDNTSVSREKGVRDYEREKMPMNSGRCVSPKPLSHDDLPEDAWSSPNTSNFCVRNNELLDRMDEFQFSQDDRQNPNNQDLNQPQNSRSRPNVENLSLTKNLKETLQAQYSLSGLKGVNDLHKDREKTPPPDGEDRLRSDRQTSGRQRNLQSQFNKMDRPNIGSGSESVVRDWSRTRDAQDRNGPSSRLDGSQRMAELSRLNTSENDHGYMPGHHIPDGTAYSQRSDYSHMDHKGMSREDVAGVDDVGLAESRGFDMLKGKKGYTSNSLGFRDSKSQNVDSKRSGDIQQYYRDPSGSTVGHGLTQNNTMSQTSAGSEHGPRTDELRHEETQTRSDLDQLESWTQTSQVFKQSVGLQSNTAEFSDNNKRESAISVNPGEFRTLNSDSFNMTDNMKVKQHCDSTNMLLNEPEKLHLLTKKTSLIKTQFAQDNLRRDFSVDVMDKIYSNKPSTYPELDSSVAQNNRLSIESEADWTHLQGSKTMDASQMSTGDMSTFNHHRFQNHLPPAHSTPMHVNGFMAPQHYSLMSQLPAGDGHQLSMGYLSATDSQLYKTPGRISLCPVESPGVLKFKDACCVGISKKEILPLKNPTDRWMECVIQVNSLEIDGQAARMEYFPFELRQKKIIIDPHKVENVDIMFLPKIPGAYVAQVQVFSRAFTKIEERKRESIPVNITFQAIAEEPWIKVHCEEDESDTLDFGEMVWGSHSEKTICLKNMGFATVPLRLAITSTRGWHCFSFEPEGRMSDVSVISGRHTSQAGQGKTIVNISLSGCKDSFNCHTIKVWCRPPDKQCTRTMARQPAEQFSCTIDVEVDIPCCKFSKLASLRMRASVGVKKLHIQSRLKEIQLKAMQNHIAETSVKMYNAGNLGLTVGLGFSDHSDVFVVTPSSVSIAPGRETEVKIAFKPKEYQTSSFLALLLMLVQPEGPIFELSLQGDVVQKKSPPAILCDTKDLDFGGVAIGKSVVKRYRLMNKGADPLSMTAESRANDVTLVMSPTPMSVGQKSVNLYIRPGETLPVYVRFSPSHPVSLSGKIIMRPVGEVTKYTVAVHGYGGVSRLCCSEDCTSSTSIQGYPCVNLAQSGGLAEIYICNTGLQSAQAKLALYTDLQCTQRLTTGQIVAQPSEFTLESQQKTVLGLVTSLSDRDLESKAELNQGLLAVLRLQYKDLVDSAKPYMSDLIIGVIKEKKERPEFSINFQTPVKSTHHIPSESTILQPLKDTTSYRTIDNTSSIRSEGSAYEKWSIKPQELVLYCSKKGSCDLMRTFNIFNNYNTDLSFEVSWPGDMLSLTPGRGIIKPRMSSVIQIFASTKISNNMDQLPWSGKVAVMVNDDLKFIKIQIRQDSSGDENKPVYEDSRLVPISTSVIQPGSGSNKMGNLEVSRTQIMFTQTASGKMAEESLWLKNVGPDMLRWMFSSFASPYLQKTADKTKEMFRVSYKVFDISRQFGKLSGHDTVQLTVQFMPRSSGMFSQYWDLQTTGNSSSYNKTHRQEYIRIHFTGEGFEEPEPESKLASLTKDLLQSIPGDTKRLLLCKDKITFPTLKPGQSSLQKVEFKNLGSEDIKAEVIVPQLPFYIKHKNFKVAKKKYLRFPVEFRPARPGFFRDSAQFQNSKGETLILQLEGECV